MNNKNGISIIDALQILFIAFKLAHIIDWSWWMVLLPEILVIGFILIVAAVKAGQ